MLFHCVLYRFLGFTSQPSRHFTKFIDSPGEISVLEGSWAQKVYLEQHTNPYKHRFKATERIFTTVNNCFNLWPLTSSESLQISLESDALPAQIWEAWCSRPRRFSWCFSRQSSRIQSLLPSSGGSLAGHQCPPRWTPRRYWSGSSRWYYHS